MKISLLFLIVVGFLCLVACNPQPSSPPTNGESAPPATTETEPEPEPQIVEVPLSYEVVDSYSREDTITHQSSIEIGGIGGAEETWEEPIFVACVEVMNTDTVAGTFLIIFSVAEPTFGEISLRSTLELSPGETKVAECPADELGDWSYEVIPSTKLIEQ
jgi:hypothetical protein